MSDKVTMTVTMSVTVPQALALQAMFRYWNRLSSMGASREVAFFVDGDGNFHPDVKCGFALGLIDAVPELTEELEDMAKVSEVNSGTDKHGQPMALFDFDAIAWSMHEEE